MRDVLTIVARGVHNKDMTNTTAIQVGITGPAFAGYTNDQVRNVRDLALGQILEVEDREYSDMLQAAIDSCNAELALRESVTA